MILVPDQRAILDPVGEDAFGPVVRDPQQHPVGPDPTRAAIELVEWVFSDQFARLEVVDEERVLDAVEYVDLVLVGPEPARVAVALGKLNVSIRQPCSASQVVREEPVLSAVGDPDRVTVRPDAV